MTYPALGHDRDSNCVHYLLDNLHTSSSCDTTCQPDIEREFIEHHYGDCSCIFCNLRLLNIGDIHNNSMLLHVCESSLNQGSPSSKWRVRTDNTSLNISLLNNFGWNERYRHLQECTANSYLEISVKYQSENERGRFEPHSN